MKQKRLEDYSIRIGTLPRGAKNKITDVKGVRGPIVAPKKKKSKLEELLKKGRGEA